MWTDERGSEILPLAECLRLLALAAKHGAVGRLAVAREGVLLVQPVNFAYRDRHVLVRVGPGTMAKAATGALVAFEVDSVEPELGRAWSVVVRGLALEEHGAERLGASHVAPAPLVPCPGDTVLSVRLDVVTGRRFSLHQGHVATTVAAASPACRGGESALGSAPAGIVRALS